MPETVRQITDSLNKTNAWLNEIDNRLHLNNKEEAYSILRGTLHTIRDRIPDGEATDFATQLPTVLRGVYYDGWSLKNSVSEKPRTSEEFLEAFNKRLGRDISIDAPKAISTAFSVISENVSEGEYTQMKEMLPKSVRPLCGG